MNQDEPVRILSDQDCPGCGWPAGPSAWSAAAGAAGQEGELMEGCPDCRPCDACLIAQGGVSDVELVPAVAYDGPCLNCGSDNHIAHSVTERECWNCFTVFIVPSSTDQAV